MFETGRRSATSTSELGLYSDRSDHYHRNRYGIGVRKYVIGIMVVLAIILVSFLLYDFTSGATVPNQGAKETKHIYILQNALKKPVTPYRKTTTTVSTPVYNGSKTELSKMEDRSDLNYEREDITGDSEELEDQIASETRSIAFTKPDPEFRSQNLNNFNLRQKLLSMDQDESEEKVREKQLFDNHAMLYLLRRRYKHPASDEDASFEESRPLPFHFEYKTPIPASFKRSKYPQLSQYRYPHNSNNIQDIIKYLTKDNEKPSRGIKFSGVYVNPKKLEFYPEVGEMMANSDKSEEENPFPFAHGFSSDPFYQYKPKNPSDVNLLATPNVRFPPSGFHRHGSSYYDQYYPRLPMNINAQSSSSSESQYDNYGSRSTVAFGKKRKAQPFSVMLDIYPIPDATDPSRKSARPRSGPNYNHQNQASHEEYDTRRPLPHNKGLTYSHFIPPPQPISLVAVPGSQGPQDDEERQQMILHLNLYPKRRTKINRNHIIPRSQRTDQRSEDPGEESVPPPFDIIAKHLTDHSAIQASKFEETQLSDNADASSIINRYEESVLATGKKEEEARISFHRERGEKTPENTGSIPANHRPDFAVESIGEKFLNMSSEDLEKTSKETCENCKNLEPTDDDSKVGEIKDIVISKDIDTPEGFQNFADGLLATD
ncbi:uncharacterized protein LOC124188018 [Neodiprion fabricii]|uniref:uncharacterized protein LOC124188018 n=1 Tax=Neodiprion fabricii TaxID=2872261 RepID=UPI001ED950E4|nr:uncharacterized protein LOC124188018 [Neodiprion fabricii]